MKTTTAHERALAAADLVSGLAFTEVEARLQVGRRRSDQSQRLLAFYLADLSDHDVHQAAGFRSVADYAETKLDIRPRRARDLVRVGKMLLDLHAIDHAFLEGRLGWSKVLLLTKVAVPAHDEAWLAFASKHSCRELRREVRRTEPGRPPRANGDRRGLAGIRFRVSVSIPPTTQEKLELATKKLAAERGGPVGEAECLDAMAELLLSLDEDGSVPGRTRVDGSLYRIVLRPEGDDLLIDTDEAGELPIDPDADDDDPKRAKSACVRCDAQTVVLSDEPPSKDGSTPEWMRRKVLARDRHRCRCCGWSYGVQAHHIQFRSHGGKTRISNLISLCERCHALVHDALLVLVGERADEVVFANARGGPLHERGSPVDPHVIRRIERPPPPEELASPRDARPVRVDLSSVPTEVDGTWWRRHASLIRLSKGTRMRFVPGRPPEAGGEEAQRARDACTLKEAFRGMVGQAARLRRFQVAAAGSRARGQPFPHTLLAGPAGTGKTTLARRLSAFLGARFVRASGPLLQDVHTLIRLLAELRESDVLFIDEVHAVPQSVLETLYEAVAERQVSLTFESGARSKAVRFRLPPFTLLAATTEGHDLPSPLLGRFGLRERLGYYAAEDLGTLATLMAGTHGVELTAGAATRLASRSRGTPRELLRLLDRLLDDTAASRRTYATTADADSDSSE